MNTPISLRKIAFIGNYLPRQCGIATFTSHLCETMASQFPEVQCFAVPVTDSDERYEYPDRVRFEIREKDLSSYERAADFLNINNVDVVCLQHEFGIYGGAAGGYILTLLRQLKMPVITTLHTVLQKPTEQQMRVTEQLIALSDRLVVMTDKASSILRNVYTADLKKISLIPHGILDIPFVDPNFYKDIFGVEGKFVILTFGLLSPDKGVEYVIRALPSVIQKHPNVVYVILGATHPALVRNDGESYRLGLQYLAEDLGVEKNIIFLNRFVSTEELKEFIGATDIYITPYLNEEQITSGTLSYAFGAGKAVISTPYWHAVELLADNRGILVPFRDAEAIAEQIIWLIENETQRHSMRKNAYLMSREMVWSNVAYVYRKTFEEARHHRLKLETRSSSARALEQRPRELPKVKLDHLFRMTDSTGVFHHAAYTVPDYREGYRTSDNARALILAVLMEDAADGALPRLSDLGSISLAFLHNAYNQDCARFRMQLQFDRTWLDETGSEECHGHALWALGTCIGRSHDEGFQNLAGQLFEQALPSSYTFNSPLAWAYTLIGIHEYFRRFDGDRFANHGRELLAGKLFQLYRDTGNPEKTWFELALPGCSAVLPHALILSGRWLYNNDMLRTGLDALSWLAKMQTSPKNCFHPLSCTSQSKTGEESDSDQLPVDSHTFISACLEAFRTTQEHRWFAEARKAFEWFLGRNDMGLPLHDSKTGGCRDVLHIDRVNLNEGAEASLAFYLSLNELQQMENTIASFREPITI